MVHAASIKIAIVKAMGKKIMQNKKLTSSIFLYIYGNLGRTTCLYSGLIQSFLVRTGSGSGSATES